MAEAEAEKRRRPVGVEVDEWIDGFALGRARTEGVLEVVQGGVTADESLERDGAGFFDAMAPIVGQK